MAVRPIDGDALKNQIRHMPRTINPDLVQYKLVQAIVADMPTLTPPNEAEKAIQRLGDFGKLFLDYSGCPRGPMGEPGGSTIEEWVTMMEPICDVDGGWWRPVPEKALQILLCEMRSLKQAVPPDHFPDSTKMVQGSTDKALTQSDLNGMDYDKVWLDYGDDGEWALVKNGRIYSLSDLEGCGFEDILQDELRGETLDWPTGHYTVYRHPPEGDADA